MEWQDTIMQILDLARWAPSGDNTQPWQFEVVGTNRVVLHGFDTREHCVYDLDGHSSQIAIGALIETAAIAASHHGMRLEAQRRRESPDARPVFDLAFIADPTLSPDPLFESITVRSVQRRPLRTRPLTATEKEALEKSVGTGHSIHWLEGFGTRLKTAVFLFQAAKLRYITQEAYEVHKDIIEWGAQFSDERVPDQSLGADRFSLLLMRHVMKSWRRVEFFNRFFAGTWLPRIQLDFIPGLACGAHFLLLANSPARTIDDYLAAGRAVQRFWLTASQLGLKLQPEVTPLIFSRYARDKIGFSAQPGTQEMANRLDLRLAARVGPQTRDRALFMGRLGAGRAPVSRSRRRSLDRLVFPYAAR